MKREKLKGKGKREKFKSLAIIKKLFILPIRFYQLFISPLLGPKCRFEPSCSNYMVEAIQEWGPLKGIWLGLKRIGKCHPWGPHGYDPVPKKEPRPSDPESEGTRTSGSEGERT